MKKYQKVEIVWIDSIAGKYGWNYISEHSFGKKESDKLTQTSCGYFIEKNELTTVIAQSMQIYIDQENDRIIHSVLQIPNGCIQKIKRLWYTYRGS